jgi:imidazolonepropionase-like amidohydrolase
MKRILIPVFILVSASLLAQPATYLLLPERVFDGQDMHEGWAVLVEGDRITGVGSRESVKTTKTPEVISMPGVTLLPGLIEGHSHLLLYPYK